MQVVRGLIFGISCKRLVELIKSESGEIGEIVHEYSFNNFTAIFVERFFLRIKSNLLGIIMLRGDSDKNINLEIACGGGGSTWGTFGAESKMLEYILKMLNNISKKHHFSVVLENSEA